MAVLPDGRIVSGSYYGTIRIWNVDSGECLKTLEGHTDVSLVVDYFSEYYLISMHFCMLCL